VGPAGTIEDEVKVKRGDFIFFNGARYSMDAGAGMLNSEYFV